MTDGDGTAPVGDDSILPFQLDELDIRGRVARIDRTLDRIVSQHAYPLSVGALIGEAALLTVMIGHALKLRGRFSLQARGDGPVSLIATDMFPPAEEGAPARVRAYAHFDAEQTPDESAAPATLLGEGVVAMTIDQGAHMRPYQGLTPLTRERLAEGGLGAGAEVYFAQSEQLATSFRTSIGVARAPGGAARWRAGGIMIQHLGEMGESARGSAESSSADGLLNAADVAEMSSSPDDWRRASLLIDTVEELELIGPHVTPEALLYRLFHEVGPRVYPAQKVTFGCTCRREAVEAVLRNYTAEALADMIGPSGQIEVDCQFCGARYVFDPDVGDQASRGDSAADVS